MKNAKAKKTSPNKEETNPNEGEAPSEPKASPVEHSPSAEFVSMSTAVDNMPGNQHEDPIVIKDGYVFNKSTDTYVVFMKNGKKHQLTGTNVRAMRHDYTVDKASKESLAAKFEIPKTLIAELLTKLEMKQDGDVFTDEELDTKTDEQIREEARELRVFKLSQDLEKDKWKEVQKAADKWNEFHRGELNPFERALEKWTPPKHKSIEPKNNTLSRDEAIVAKQLHECNALSDDQLLNLYAGHMPKAKPTAYNPNSSRSFVIALSDLHYGSASRARYMLNGKGWTTENTVECVARYAAAITREALDRRSGFKKATVLCLGDLIHSVSGKTARGTELSYDVVREEQYEYALDSLTAFFSSMLETFEQVEVHDVGGNHFYEMDMAVLSAISKHFRTNPRIKFTHHSTRPAAFRDGATLFMMDHGADAIERAYVPTVEKKREVHILNLMVKHPELIVGAKTKLFLQGDKHHWEHTEEDNFEFIMFGTIIGEDIHSTVNNLNNRARQSGLIIDDNDGLVNTVQVHFD